MKNLSIVQLASAFFIQILHGGLVRVHVWYPNSIEEYELFFLLITINMNLDFDFTEVFIVRIHLCLSMEVNF